MNLSGEGIEEADSTTDDEEEDEVGRIGHHGLNIKRILIHLQERQVDVPILFIHSQIGYTDGCSSGTV